MAVKDLELVKNSKKYFGQYVAVKSFSDRTVISHGLKPMVVIKEAERKGIQEPVLIFVPQKGMLNVY
jgi:hypothetical protein